MTVRVFDMFCGAGGSSWGAALAGASPVVAFDRWGVATQTYSLNFPGAKVYTTLAQDLSPLRVRDDVGAIDMILASPECTSHSVAKGSAPRCEKSRETAFEVVRFAEALNPQWLVVENVERMRHWSRFDEWYSCLRRLGYHTTATVIDAKDHGAPQSRRRLFVLCDRECPPSVPLPRRGPARTVRSILGTGESTDNPWKYRPLFTPRRAQATVERATRAIKSLGCDEEFLLVYYSNDGAGFQTLNRPLRTVTTRDHFAHVRRNCRGYEMRMLQPPELAAAMGFPDYHRFPPTTRQNVIHLIGNAVCPPVMRDIVAQLTGRLTLRP